MGLIEMRYTNPCSHLYAKNQETGMAIRLATINIFMNTDANKATTCLLPAPSTFRIPISLVRCSAVYEARLNTPNNSN